MSRSVINLDDLTTNNLGVLKKINEVSLPAKYSDDWYKGSFDHDQITQLAFYLELPVGGIKAKLLKLTNDLNDFSSFANASLLPKMVPNVVYIETLAVLKAYRGVGIGKKLLDFIIEQTKQRFVHEIRLHVETTNEDVINWYLKQGFEKIDTIKGYYAQQKLENPDALVLSLKV